MSASNPFPDKHAPQTPFMTEDRDPRDVRDESVINESNALMPSARDNDNIFNCTTERTPITQALSTAGGGIFGGIMGVETGIVTSTSPLLWGIGGFLGCAGLTFFSTFLCGKKPNVASGNAPEVNNRHIFLDNFSLR